MKTKKVDTKNCPYLIIRESGKIEYKTNGLSTNRDLVIKSLATLLQDEAFKIKIIQSYITKEMRT